jgi:hypothetical protein
MTDELLAEYYSMMTTINELLAERDAAVAACESLAEKELAAEVQAVQLKRKLDAQAAEFARLREALCDIAKYDVGLQNLIDDAVYEETETSRYYAMNISWRQKLARKALDGETK